MFLVDSHCHLDGLDYQTLHKNVDDVLAKAAARDVKFCLAVATTLPGYRSMRELVGTRDNVVFSCGVHPLNQDEPWEVETLRALAAEEGVVAMGETGLDYFYTPETKAQQQSSFRDHIRIGRELNKPVIVHTRDARADTLAILREEKVTDCGGVLHCFTVERFKKNHPKTPVISARNKEKDFEELCKLIGPPSRVMRWCCTVFKTGTIQKKIRSLYRDKKQILTFYGIRRSESVSRSKYERESDSPKITKQRIISPIIDWMDFDIWLYILTTGIDFNDAYRLGYARVGCWCCPNNSGWSEFLSKVHMHEQSKHFREMLIDFATSIGKVE